MAPTGLMDGELVVVEDVAGEFAERFIEAFHARPADEFHVALSGGSTARACYERLAAEAGGQVDWSSVVVWWGDERAVPLDHDESNHRLACEALLDRVGRIEGVDPPAAVHPMPALDGEAGAASYGAAVGSVRIDLCHLGLGPDGHTASLFPGAPALEADDDTLVAATSDPTGRNDLPRLTFTLPMIARSRLVLVTVEGEPKRAALDAVRRDDQAAPASRVRAERLVWLADPAAAGEPPTRFDQAPPP